jgi:hypothetical protein
MKFYISSAFLNTREIVEIAKAADELGYDGIGIPDHVVNLETLETPYPYTKDGQRRWRPFTDWPDPWVLVGALAQVTTGLRFVTTVTSPRCAIRTRRRKPLALRRFWRQDGWSSASASAGAERSSL